MFSHLIWVWVTEGICDKKKTTSNVGIENFQSWAVPNPVFPIGPSITNTYVTPPSAAFSDQQNDSTQFSNWHSLEPSAATVYPHRRERNPLQEKPDQVIVSVFFTVASYTGRKHLFLLLLMTGNFLIMPFGNILRVAGKKLQHAQIQTVKVFHLPWSASLLSPANGFITSLSSLYSAYTQCIRSFPSSPLASSS